MPFVDAQRYLKVLDSDIDSSFNDDRPSHDDKHRHARNSDDDEDNNNTEDVNSKYNKASFEAFQLDPTFTHHESSGFLSSLKSWLPFSSSSSRSPNPGTYVAGSSTWQDCEPSDAQKPRTCNGYILPFVVLGIICLSVLASVILILVISSNSDDSVDFDPDAGGASSGDVSGTSVSDGLRDDDGTRQPRDVTLRVLKDGMQVVNWHVKRGIHVFRISASGYRDANTFRET